MLNLKLQNFGHLMQRTDSLEKTLMLGKTEGRKRSGWQRMRWLDGIIPTQWTWVWVDSGSWWWTGRPGVLQFMGSQRVWHNWATELKWTELNWKREGRNFSGGPVVESTPTKGRGYGLNPGLEIKIPPTMVQLRPMCP